MKLPFRIPFWRVLGYGLLVWALGGGFSSDPRQAIRAAKRQKGWLDAGPSCVLPIDAKTIPAGADEFAGDLSRGATQMALIPAAQNVVTLNGDFPTLDSLSVDLSNGIEDGAHTPPKINNTKPIWTVGVADYEVKAEPLLINGAKLYFDLTASDAQLEMRQDSQKNSIILLTGARQARFSSTVADPDIQSVCSTSAKTLAKKFGFDVKSCTAALSTPTDHEIDVKLHVKLGRPIGGDLMFTARMDIADDLTGKVTNITCHGSGPTGILISTLLTPVLFLQNGTTRPLLQFPGDRMGARDVQVKMDQAQPNGPPPELHVNVDFGDWADAPPVAPK